MKHSRIATDTRYHVLAYLLTGVLLLSTGLNCYLLRDSATPHLPADAADAEELAVVERELVQARTQLARCQGNALAPDTLALRVQGAPLEAGFGSE